MNPKDRNTSPRGGFRDFWGWADESESARSKTVENIDDFQIKTQVHQDSEPDVLESENLDGQPEPVVAVKGLPAVHSQGTEIRDDAAENAARKNKLQILMSISEVEDVEYSPVESNGDKDDITEAMPGFLRAKSFSEPKPGKPASQSEPIADSSDVSERRRPAAGEPEQKRTQEAAVAPTIQEQRRAVESEIAQAIPSRARRRNTLRRKRGWGYGFVMTILLTIFGSITVSTYLVFLRTNVTIPNIIVYVSIISLFFFLLILIFRYLVLIYLSFLHHAKNRAERNIKVDPNLKASILVPAYNEEKVIEQSIKSLLELDYPNYEVIVINDGSKDKTYELAKRLEGWHLGVHVRVLTQPNMGKAMALNHGASKATGDVVVCMDGDSRLDIDTLKYGMRHFINPEIGAVAGNVKVVNRSNLLTMLQALEYIEGLNLVRRAQAFLKAVNIVPGPCGFFRRDALLKVGGWDNDTFAEDCDITLKFLTKKYKIEYEPDAISYTEAPEKLVQLLKQRYRWTRGILQAQRKYSVFLVNPLAGWRVLLTMWQMVFESIIWPLMNVGANLLFIVVALLFGMSPLIVLWWIQLTVLDTIAAMHTIAIERERLSLIPLAIIYRLVFIQIVDVSKLIATIEEMLNVKMGWGKLERTGRL